MNRKEFLKAAGGACITLSGIPTFLSGCTTLHSVNVMPENNTLSLAKSEFIEIKKGEERKRELVVVRAASLAFPIVVFRNEQNAYTALWMECTHQSCEVKAQPGYLVCPCHGSEYDAEGKVLNGPAEKNLRTFKTTTDHENIYIHL